MPWYKKYRKNQKRAPRKGKKYQKKKRVPRVDLVVTKNFKFIGYTAQTTNQDCILGNSKNQIASNNIAFRPNMIPGTKNYSDIYTHFRFDSITVRFLPMTATMQVDDTDVGTSASTLSKATPRFYLTRSYGNEVPADFTYENENSALVDGARSCSMTKPMTFKWCPNSLTPSQTLRGVYSGMPTQTGWDVKKKTWHSCNDMNTLFYGLKYLISSTNSDDSEFLYKMLVNAKISFKGNNDANYGSEFGSTATVVTPFTQATT